MSEGIPRSGADVRVLLLAQNRDEARSQRAVGEALAEWGARATFLSLDAFFGQGAEEVFAGADLEVVRVSPAAPPAAPFGTLDRAAKFACVWRNRRRLAEAARGFHAVVCCSDGALERCVIEAFVARGAPSALLVNGALFHRRASLVDRMLRRVAHGLGLRPYVPGALGQGGCERVFAMGEQARGELFKLRLTSTRVHVCGAPRFASLVERMQASLRGPRGNAARPKVLLYLAGAHDWHGHAEGADREGRQLRALDDLLDKFGEELVLRIRPHPRSSARECATLGSLRNASLCPASEPLAEALEGADAVLSTGSTAALEAMAQGKPALYVDVAGIYATERARTYVNHGGWVVRTQDELRQALDELGAAPQRVADRVARQAGVFWHFVAESTPDAANAIAAHVLEAVERSRLPVRILGVNVHPMTVEDVHARIATLVSEGGRGLILNANVHALDLASRDEAFRAILNDADRVFCDGAGVRLGARVLGRRLPERITYADWMWQLAERAAEEGWSLFFLGAAPGVAERAAERLRQRTPSLRIVGVRDGFFDPVPGSADGEAVVAAIAAERPDILVVGLGMPLQEQWLARNAERLDVRVALSGGAVFDYVSGSLERPPAWLRNHGFEWLGRLVVEPRRLWRRYLLGNPRFVARIARQAWRERLR